MTVQYKMTDQELDMLGESFLLIKSMNFIQFVEAVNTDRLQLNIKGATPRLAMDRFEQPLWYEKPEPLEQDPMDAYKTNRDEEIENNDDID